MTARELKWQQLENFIGKGNEMQTASKFHDFSYGHRVFGHESKCAHLHGHNGRVHFKVTAPDLDKVGRIMDFGVIGNLLCQWVESNWDHKFLVYKDDPWAAELPNMDPKGVVIVNFNPTAENMARYLVDIIGPQQLVDTGCTLIEVIVEETRKCSCSYAL